MKRFALQSSNFKLQLRSLLRIWGRERLLTKKALESKNSRALVPRTGIEPVCLAALVFETSASTNSAIWAWT